MTIPNSKKVEFRTVENSSQLNQTSLRFMRK